MSEKHPSIIFGDFSKPIDNLKFQNRRRMPSGSQLPEGNYKVIISGFNFFYETGKFDSPLRFVWDCRILSGDFINREIRYSYRMDELNKEILFKNLRVAGLNNAADFLSIFFLQKDKFKDLKFRLFVSTAAIRGAARCRAVFQQRVADDEKPLKKTTSEKSSLGSALLASTRFCRSDKIGGVIQLNIVLTPTSILSTDYDLNFFKKRGASALRFFVLCV